MLPFIELGPLKLPTYGLMLCIALLAGIQLAVSRAPRHNLPPQFVYTSATVAALVAVLGGKLTNILLLGASLEFNALATNAGTFLGGFLMALAAVAFMAHRARLPVLRVADCFAPSVALGVALVRVGCFGAGCDYGKPTTLPWGVVFTNPFAADFTGVPLGVRLHPSQLYESALGLLALVVLLWLARRPRPEGFLILVFAVIYSAGRFVLEFWRGDTVRGFFGPFSTSQWLSLVTIAVFWGMWQWTRRSNKVTQ